jgi:hypothetical protein
MSAFFRAVEMLLEKNTWGSARSTAHATRDFLTSVAMLASGAFSSRRLLRRFLLPPIFRLCNKIGPFPAPDWLDVRSWWKQTSTRPLGFSRARHRWLSAASYSIALSLPEQLGQSRDVGSDPPPLVGRSFCLVRPSPFVSSLHRFRSSLAANDTASRYSHLAEETPRPAPTCVALDKPSVAALFPRLDQTFRDKHLHMTQHCLT